MASNEALEAARASRDARVRWDVDTRSDEEPQVRTSVERGELVIDLRDDAGTGPTAVTSPSCRVCQGDVLVDGVDRVGQVVELRCRSCGTRTTERLHRRR